MTPRPTAVPIEARGTQRGPSRRCNAQPSGGAGATHDELDAYSGDRNFVMSFARGMSVLQAFAQCPGPMTLIEISRSIHIPRSAVRRLLYTLSELGYVRLVGARYTLTHRSLELATAYTDSNDFVREAQPIVARLSKRLRTFCALSVQQGGHTMLTCLAGNGDIAGARHLVPGLGSKAPLYAAASGHVFLSACDESQLDDYFARTAMLPLTARTPNTSRQLRAALCEVREKGYAACDRTLADSVYSVAVPVRGADGQVVASMLAGMAFDRLQDADMKAMLVPALTAAARDVGHHLN